MAETLTIGSVDVHAEGEPGRVLLGHDLEVPGAAMAERLAWCTEHLDDLRTLLLREPRGHPALCGVLVMPPVGDDADASLVVLEHGGFKAMSGSNTMCAVTALLETGVLPMHEPETVVRLDTAAGRVEAVARVRGDKVLDVQVRNVPSWVHALDVPIEVPEYGTVSADIAFGGQYYVQAPAAAMGLELGPAHARDIVRAGAALLACAREQVSVTHPYDPALAYVSLVMLHGPAVTPGTSARNSVVLTTGPVDAHDPRTWRGTVDRSPCGTGTSARMACLHARGELGVDEAFVHEGILGTTFEGRLHGTTEVDGRPAVLPSIRGRAWITGRTTHLLDRTDPFPRGFTVGDVWGASAL